MKGQVTIEYILVLVVMLVILATVSLPTIDRMEQDVLDTGTAVNLASIQQKIVNTANELSLAGCGSHKNITVHVDEDPFNEGKVSWNQTHVAGSYYQQDGQQQNLIPLPLPEYINITSSSSTPTGYFTVKIQKNCDDELSTEEGCVGYDC